MSALTNCHHRRPILRSRSQMTLSLTKIRRHRSQTIPKQVVDGIATKNRVSVLNHTIHHPFNPLRRQLQFPIQP